MVARRRRTGLQETPASLFVVSTLNNLFLGPWIYRQVRWKHVTSMSFVNQAGRESSSQRERAGEVICTPPQNIDRQTFSCIPVTQGKKHLLLFDNVEMGRGLLQ